MGNCTSQNPVITSLSLQVFVALMESFKDHLKSELEVFVSNIFLRILESENSPHEHKRRVLDVLDSIISDPSALVEIFINYDCDFEAIDLFRRIVDAFSKISKVKLNIFHFNITCSLKKYISSYSKHLRVK
jgi:brefeldin A-inhibited guanine nucleotide-exchange protein